MTEPTSRLHVGHRVADGVNKWITTVRFADASQTLEPVASYGEAIARAGANGCDSLHFDVGVLDEMVAATRVRPRV